MEDSRSPRTRAAPLDAERLRALALAYAGRYATTRRRLADYLRRKLRERGWAGEGDADVAGLVEDFARLAYVDDEAFAANRASSLLRRGYGPARLKASLRQSGIEQQQAEKTLSSVDEETARAAAFAFARRKRIGPYTQKAVDPAVRQKAMAAMLRAGHGYEIAREILNMPQEGGANEGAV